MWQLENSTPFAAERGWVRDRDGAEIWLVAVKCTFDVGQDGAITVADHQPPVTIAPEFVDPKAPGGSSLRYESDLVRTKVTTDVIVHGHAYVPGGAPATHCDVGFRVGDLAKQLRVTGDRVWLDGVASAPVAFARMPLVYERAYGGYDRASVAAGAPRWDVRNPVGQGYARSLPSAAGQRVPNIEYRDAMVFGIAGRPPPASFGPVAAHWQPRAALAGTYDDIWQADRFPLLPNDFDDRYYQCAPADQQAARFLSGGEPVRLLNLSPAPLPPFQLPRLFLGFETMFAGGERQLHERPKLHTVIIEPDYPRLSLVWHSALPCHPKVLKLKKTRIYLKRVAGRPDAAGVEAA